MAIAVAKDAGAEKHAADQLVAAENYLDSAEKLLNEKSYSQARRDALRAKRSAMDALLMSEKPESDDSDDSDQ